VAHSQGFSALFASLKEKMVEDGRCTFEMNSDVNKLVFPIFSEEDYPNSSSEIDKSD
jgi:hypothetical protein